MSNKAGKRLVPTLRFPEFRDGPEWRETPLEDLISTIPPPKKIPTTEYLAEGAFPIVDQGQSHIAGWTNDSDALIKNDLPLIVFGDHTCALKLVNQPFAQGADGIKVIKGKHTANTEYLYQFLCFRPVVTEEYKRHFSILKTRVVAYPEKPSGEQQKIAACLSSLDDLIAAQAKKIEALKAHKKGLMQQLFPAEGETVPRLRFPEFRDASEWRAKKIATFLQRVSNPVEVEPSEFYREIGIRSHGKGIFHKEMVSGTRLGDKRVFWVEESTLVLNIVFAWEQAVATVSKDEAGMIASHRFPMFRGKNKTSVEFVKHFLLTNRGKFLLGLASPGGAGRNRTLGQKEFENLEFHVPVDLDEQVLIADCLSSLDTLIFAHTQKLYILNTHKKGLMQGLFPSMAEADA